MEKGKVIRADFTLCLPEPVMHKNRLQEYTQKSGLPLPVYETKNEGFPHAPQFTASVLVNRKKFISRLTYRHVKDAEQDAAEVALEFIKEEINNEESITVPDIKYCKSILNEYAFKMNLDSPKYTINQLGRLHPVFLSTLEFNEKRYTGQVGKSKKEAEQLAARVTIQSLLESNSCNYLREIIKSKIKIFGKSHELKHSTTASDQPQPQPEDSLKKLIDTLGSTVGIYVRNPIVDSDHQSKRKLDSSNLGNKKKLRQDGFEVLSTTSEKTKGKGIDANFMPRRFGKYYVRREKPNSSVNVII